MAPRTEMKIVDGNGDARKLEARIATLEELLRALEQTVVEQSERLERSGAAQSHLATIVQSADTAIISLSLDFCIQTWNPGAERLFGYALEEVIGRSPADVLFPSTEKSRALAEFFTDVETFRHPVRNARYFEETFQRKDGTLFEASLIGSGIYDAAGELTGVSGLVRDISEQRSRERDLARLAGIVESSDDGIISFGTDLRITSWNRGCERLLGFAAGEAIGRTNLDLYVAPEFRDHALSLMRQDLATLQGHSTIFHQLEVPVRRKDGTRIEVLIAVSGIYDRGGKLVGMSNILRDITDRKRAERDLAIMASIVNACNDAIIGFSRDLKITSWNPAAEATYGFTAKEAIGSGFDLFVPAEELAWAIDADQRLFETGQPVSFEQRAQKKDKSWFVSWINVFPIRDAAGNIVAGAGIGRDITDRKRAERELATLASIVNASEDAIISVSKDLKITSWNAAAEKAYGFTAKQAIGQGLDLFVPPAELVQTLAASRRVFETGQPASWEQRVENKKDGTRFVSAVNIFVTRDDAGNIMEVAGIGRDISRLKEIEKELREAHEYTRGLIDSSIDAMVVVDGEMRIMRRQRATRQTHRGSEESPVGLFLRRLFRRPCGRAGRDQENLRRRLYNQCRAGLDGGQR